MGKLSLNKRQFLLMGTALAATGLLGRRAAAQSGELFGIKVPKQVLDLLPAKPLSIAYSVETVLRLEKEADFKKLPQSILALGKGKAFFGGEDTLYQVLLPRLVALIDRSELRDLKLANQSGSLLADLHATQHVVPEALTTGEGADGILQLGAPMQFLALDPVINVPLPTVQLPIPLPPEQPAPPSQDDNQPISRSRQYADLKDEYVRLFNSTSVRSAYDENVDWCLTMIDKSRPRYESVGKATGVPWYFIAVVHGLESSFNFRAHLHNGDYPLTARTRQVPSGRPLKWLPPTDWESSARDALKILGFTGQSDWTLARTLYRLEVYNGLGYRNYGVPTPYLWSFSNHYDRGKYTSDGKFSTTAKSQQCGAAVMLKQLVDAGQIRFPEA